MNKERFKQLRDLIVSKDESQLQMERWFVDARGEDLKTEVCMGRFNTGYERFGDCGTAGCIAGWCCTLIPSGELYVNLSPGINATRFLLKMQNRTYKYKDGIRLPNVIMGLLYASDAEVRLIDLFQFDCWNADERHEYIHGSKKKAMLAAMDRTYFEITGEQINVE